MEFKLNARNTKHGKCDNSFWLMKAGFVGDDITAAPSVIEENM
jgi:hypothetical protein